MMTVINVEDEHYRERNSLLREWSLEFCFELLSI